MMGYGQPGMMPPRPRYPNNPQVGGLPIPAPYQQPYGMPGYPGPAGRGGPRPGPPPPRGPGSPTLSNAGAPRPNGAPVNGAPRAPPPQGQSRPAPAGVPPPPPAGRSPQGQQPPSQPQGYKLNPQTRNAPGAAAPAAAPIPDAPGFNHGLLANASPNEQKQLLGEHIYMRIAGTQPELAGKITGMLLEMDNTELIQLLDSQEAMNNKVQEALIVLQEYTTKEE